MYKKIISSILAVFVMFSLAGCAEEDSSTVAVAADAEGVEEEKNKKPFLTDGTALERT